MPLMRDKETGIVREVHERYLARFKDEYEPIEAPKKRPSKKSTATPAVGATETPQGEE